MKSKQLPSLAFIKECFSYSEDSESGLIWNKRPSSHFKSIGIMGKFNKKCTNKQAGCISSNGYYYIGLSINGARHQMLCHRIVYSIFNDYGFDTSEEVDHIDGVKSNNREWNLRLATRQENNFNTGAYKTSKTGVRGVHMDNGRFRSQAQHNNKIHSIGTFDSLAEAEKAYNEFTGKIHNEFHYTNR